MSAVGVAEVLRLLFRRRRFVIGGLLPEHRPDHDGILIRLSHGRGCCLEPECDWEYVGDDLGYMRATARHQRKEHH